MPETILGLNAYHGDAAAALFVDGVLVAAAEEERFTRLKHHAGYPSNAVRWCLESAGMKPEQIDHVSIGRDPGAHVYRKLLFTLARRPSAKMLRGRLSNARKAFDVRAATAAAFDMPPEKVRARFHRVEHHRAHLASAYLCSPFDDAACLSVDGMGDFCSTMWARGVGSRMDIDGFINYPHSLGIYYTAFTQFLGLPNYGDEYKLMGLAAYGKPNLLPEVRRVLEYSDGARYRLGLDYFIHHTDGVDMTWADGTPEIGPIWSAEMARAFGPAREFRGPLTPRDEDLASSIQARLEEVMLGMLRDLHARTRSDRLVMAGGVALNCVVNGKVRAETPFTEVWVQPAANDSGTAIGAALWTWTQTLKRPRAWTMEHAYYGPSSSDAEMRSALDDAGLPYETLADDVLADRVAALIADGGIVGWFQGNMEFGPRALGNRSIVCDPRRTDMKDILNARIKLREYFRPFAPSVLAERTGDWFADNYPSPYMLMAYDVLPGKRELIPAVTHEDGTARLQTVTRASNPRYYGLIEAFERHTGVPVLLNTSFNENEPICCLPREAVDCFNRTRMDALVLGSHLVVRKMGGV